MLKKLSRLGARLILALGLAGAAEAQTIGYTNQEALLANMPQYQEVAQQLQQAAQQEQQALQSEQQDFQEQVAQYQRRREMLDEEQRAQREQELGQVQMSLQQSARQRDSTLARRESELMQPLYENIRDAINAEAEAQGLDMVVRSQTLLYVNEESVVDITEDVARRLGIDVDGTASSNG